MPLIDTAPSDEAAQALIWEINQSLPYCVDFEARYSRVAVDPFELIEGVRVDIVIDKEKQLSETLDYSDNSSHTIKIWVRSQLPQDDSEVIAELALLTRQLYLQFHRWNSIGRRVQVWEADVDEHDAPMKAALKKAQLFVSTVTLRIEVLR